MDGVKHGEGYYQWSEEDFYRGEFKKGKIEGKGRLETRDYLFEGKFVLTSNGHADS